MPRLVALDLPGGPGFVTALRRTWDDGDAVLVVDRRLAPAARDELLDLARPDDVVGGPPPRAGSAPHRDGEGLAAGDALVVATSGSTGTPKLVVHTHEGLAAHARAVHERLAVDPDRDRWLACLPLAHLGGLGVVVRSLVTATPLDVIDGFDADVVAAAPRRLGTTLVSLVPTALDRIDASAFRWVVLGGSADPGERPANVVRTYGLTETGGGVVYDGVPLPGVVVRVGPGPDRSAAGSPPAGPVFVRGPSLARGLRRADGTVGPLTGPDGWLATGDVGWFDGEDRLVVSGRADDLIVTGGENVWPAAVEAVLLRHPAVAEVVVFGRDDPEWGRRVVARVVPVDPARPPTLADLRDHVRAELAAHAAPRELELVDALPRTALGKPVRS